jgi:glutathione S-transferase
MQARLYVVHGSHPCAAVERALELKGIGLTKVELPPPLHAPIQRVLFGQRTVPGIVLGGEKVVGSRAIMRRIDALEPEPALYPADPEARAAVEEAEAWGDMVFQPVARRLLWPALRRRPDAMVSYSDGSKIALPPPVIRAGAPLIARAEIALNGASEEVARADLRALPGHVDRIDAWIAEGVIGQDQPNAADLQIAATVGLLLTVGDIRPLLEGRPAGKLGLDLFPEFPGRVPAGTYPHGWLPAVPAAA